MCWQGNLPNQTVAARYGLRKLMILRDVFAGAIQFGTWRMQQQMRKIADSVAGGSTGDVLSKAKALGLGRRKPKKCFRQLPAMVMASGDIAQGRIDLDRLWLEHFCKQEAGEIMDADVFVRQTQDTARTPSFDIDTSVVPTRSELEKVLGQTKTGKAAGLDEMPGELLRFLPSSVSRLVFPLVLKSTLHSTQPIHWRGGMLCEALKSAGPSNAVDSYRSLCIGSTLGKAHHRLILEGCARFL